jgi:hypothetical protein
VPPALQEELLARANELAESPTPAGAAAFRDWLEQPGS